MTNAAWQAAAGGAGDHGRRHATWPSSITGCVGSTSDARGANETFAAGWLAGRLRRRAIRDVIRAGVPCSAASFGFTRADSGIAASLVAVGERRGQRVSCKDSRAE
jgi:hypothetical protein